jgi:hypothetical protein
LPKKTLADYKRKFQALQKSLEHHRLCRDTANTLEKKKSYEISILKNITEKEYIKDRLQRMGFKQWNQL